MNKSDKFDEELRDIAQFARVISHPARLSILQYLSKSQTCISGDISDFLPLSRTTVSQHLKELRDFGLIHGEIDGLKINYCICPEMIHKYLKIFNLFFEPIKSTRVECNR